MNGMYKMFIMDGMYKMFIKDYILKLVLSFAYLNIYACLNENLYEMHWAFKALGQFQGLLRIF